MAEICTPPHILHDDSGNEVVTFTMRHSWSDIVRWICRNPVDRDEVMRLLREYPEGFMQ
jgi:hypothetical protein